MRGYPSRLPPWGLLGLIAAAPRSLWSLGVDGALAQVSVGSEVVFGAGTQVSPDRTRVVFRSRYVPPTNPLEVVVFDDLLGEP